jgi:hypothetical protein
MKCVYKNENLSKANVGNHEAQLTDFGFRGNISVNICVSRIQHSESSVDYFWDSELTSNKTITIVVDGIAQIIIGLTQVKTFHQGQLVPVKAAQMGIKDGRKKSIIVML